MKELGGTQHLIRPTNGQYVLSRAQPYQTRRTHKKSRGGCITCKRRRIKCDEKKPTCAQCRQRELTCRYGPLPSIPGSELWPGQKSPIVLTEHAEFSSDKDLELLRHFWTNVVHHMMIYPKTSTPPKDIVGITLRHPHTMHATLALAALHIRQTKGAEDQTYEEILHWTQAITIFRKMLTKDWDNEADAVLATSMFLNTLAYVDLRPMDDPSIITKPPTFGWLRIQIGFVHLIWRASLRATSEIWLPFFRNTAPDLSIIHDDRPGTVDIPEEFIDLFEVNESSTVDNHPHLRALRRICHILKFERKPINTIRFLQFVQGVTMEFIQLLESLDPKALLLCSYWLGCLCVVNLWWCRNRSFNECRAICAYLHRMHPELIDYLELPASCCGYDLHRDDRELNWREDGYAAS